jgi:hypothetical protein
MRRTKLNPGSDRAFYSMPRFVKHVDDRFLAQVTQLYRERIPPGGWARVLSECCATPGLPLLALSSTRHNPHAAHAHAHTGAGAMVLDLCSSWVSHLPPDVTYRRVIGHGLNAAELARNGRLESFFVRDLNAEPDGWALADGSVDAVTCCVRCVVSGWWVPLLCVLID